MKKTEELIPRGRQKSYYRKAYIIYEDEKTLYLKSYDTLVAKCTLKNGVNALWEIETFTKLWYGYSLTTMNHINTFMQYLNAPYCKGKLFWDKLDLDKTYTLEEIRGLHNDFCIYYYSNILNHIDKI